MILNESEVKCDQCDGTGVLSQGWMCPKCYGKGKLDWVTNAMGGQITDLWYVPVGTYRGKVYVDVDGVSGTTYPIGTASKPVNNIYDAKIIAKERGLKC